MIQVTLGPEVRLTTVIGSTVEGGKGGGTDRHLLVNFKLFPIKESMYRYPCGGEWFPTQAIRMIEGPSELKYSLALPVPSA